MSEQLLEGQTCLRAAGHLDLHDPASAWHRFQRGQQACGAAFAGGAQKVSASSSIEVRHQGMVSAYQPR